MNSSKFFNTEISLTQPYFVTGYKNEQFDVITYLKLNLISFQTTYQLNRIKRESIIKIMG